ncbi:M23 family peptidase, partial [Pseudomonas sp. BGM005]|nr:M23 family peptidase [Pseudomonas sp. BG5]
PAESRSFWQKGSLSRRGAHGVGHGALGVVALSAFGVTNGVTAAYAASYPSWDDVQNAMRNVWSKAEEISGIEGVVACLLQKVAETPAAA